MDGRLTPFTIYDLLRDEDEVGADYTPATIEREKAAAKMSEVDAKNGPMNLTEPRVLFNELGHEEEACSEAREAAER